MITRNFGRMMCALLASIFLLAGCAATCPQPTKNEKPAFSELIERVEAQRAWYINNTELAALFQSERKRLGERFEAEVIKFIGDDPERHYWISLYLCDECYLHDQKAMPYLALAIKQQGIALSGGRKDIESMADTYSLSVNAAVLAKKLGLDALAREHKKRAVDLLSKEPVLEGASPAMLKKDLQLYKSI